MRYAIVFILRDEAARYHKKLVQEIAARFGTMRHDKRVPPHITLKRPFIINDIKPVEGALLSFSSVHHKTTLKLKGFGSFDKKVIFIEVFPSAQMLKVIKELKKVLSEIPEVTFDEFDKDTKFHATLAYKDIDTVFDEAYKFISGKEDEFDLCFDRISLLREEDDIWKVYQEYSLQ